MGRNPEWLYFDSKLVPYRELSRVNERGIHFVTIRRRGAAILRRLQAVPRSQWRTAVIDIPTTRSLLLPVGIATPGWFIQTFYLRVR